MVENCRKLVTYGTDASLRECGAAAGLCVYQLVFPIQDVVACYFVHGFAAEVRQELGTNDMVFCLPCVQLQAWLDVGFVGFSELTKRHGWFTRGDCKKIMFPLLRFALAGKASLHFLAPLTSPIPVPALHRPGAALLVFSYTHQRHHPSQWALRCQRSAARKKLR